MVFIWVDQGIREPYVPRIQHLPMRSAAPIHEDISSNKIDIHQEQQPSISYEYKKAISAYQEAGGKEEHVRQLLRYADEIMSSPVVTLKSQQIISDAEALFREKRFRHIPVVNEEKQLQGIISDRDIIRYKLEYGVNAETLVLEQVMKKRILTAPKEAYIRDIAGIMLKERIGSMIIVEDDNIPIGIITRTDILRAVVTHAPLELWG